MLEDDPTFNAGNGAVRNAEAAIEMDVAVMDGHTLNVGAVACVRNLRNPVSAAVAMLEAAPVFFAVGIAANNIDAVAALPRDELKELLDV